MKLAQKVGITRQTIGLIEKTELNPRLHLCLCIILISGILLFFLDTI